MPLSDFSPNASALGEMSPELQQMLRAHLAQQQQAKLQSPLAQGGGQLSPTSFGAQAIMATPAAPLAPNPQLQQTLINGPNQTTTPFSPTSTGGFTSGKPATTALTGGAPIESTWTPGGYRFDEVGKNPYSLSGPAPAAGQLSSPERQMAVLHQLMTTPQGSELGPGSPGFEGRMAMGQEYGKAMDRQMQLEAARMQSQAKHFDTLEDQASKIYASELARRLPRETDEQARARAQHAREDSLKSWRTGEGGAGGPPPQGPPATGAGGPPPLSLANQQHRTLDPAILAEITGAGLKTGEGGQIQEGQKPNPEAIITALLPRINDISDPAKMKEVVDRLSGIYGAGPLKDAFANYLRNTMAEFGADGQDVHGYRLQMDPGGGWLGRQPGLVGPGVNLPSYPTVPSGAFRGIGQRLWPKSYQESEKEGARRAGGAGWLLKAIQAGQQGQ